MKKAIIHISDLHVTYHMDSNGELIQKRNILSFFNTDTADSETDAYLDKIINVVKRDYPDYEFYLIVTGDITDKGLVEEFSKAFEVLTKFITELKIDKLKILLVPGDHDVNWDSCKAAYEKIENKVSVKAYDCHNEKLKYYKDFVDRFYEDSTFDPNKAISRTLNFENEILFLGLNSNFKVGTKPAYGFIPKEQLESEIKEIDNNKPLIGIFHHNFIAEYEDSAFGQWDKKNLNQIKGFLKSVDTRAVFYGNEHTPASSVEKQLYSSSCGSLGCKKAKSRSFKIYRLNNENSGLKFEIDFITQRDHGNHNSFELGYFDKESNPENEIDEIIIKQPILENTTNSMGEIPYVTNIKKEPQIEVDLKKGLFKIIKEKKLFHSGHFHWSETSRAHNWIDVTKILNNIQYLSLAKDAVIDLINKNILAKGQNFDFIIGLGIEGNILSTKLAIRHEKPYSFLPYSYRYDDHNDSEKELCYENDGIYQSVLIITDVVNDGRTIRKLIHKRADKFFNKVKKIFVVSLFYTGDAPNKNPSILNLSIEKINDKGIKGDHIENRIEYYYVLDMKVEKCPYMENYRQECLIMREPSLGCVHRFYDEEKALKKNNKLKKQT
jgi:orotate phosphoribosyltransferase